MGRNTRIQKLENKLAIEEAEFRDFLVRAAQECVRRRTPLFLTPKRADSLGDVYPMVVPEVTRELVRRAAIVKSLKAELEITNDGPVELFEAYCERTGSNDFGHSRLAMELLKRLA
jgi:hypothetical protein